MSERKFPVKINTVRISKPRLEVYYPKVSGCESGVAEKRINNKIISLKIGTTRIWKGKKLHLCQSKSDFIN